MIELQFVLGEGLSSRLIAWWGQSTGGFSHVDAVLPDGSLLGARSDAIGGQPPGVRIRPQGYEKWIRRERVKLHVDFMTAAKWEYWLRQQVGEPYDKGAIWGDIVGRRLHEAGHWICSAVQMGALRHIGKVHPVKLADSQVTPDSLHFLVTAGLGFSK